MTTEKILPIFSELLADRPELRIDHADNCPTLSRCFRVLFTPPGSDETKALMPVIAISETEIVHWMASSDATLRDWLRHQD
jgi:hypothetical protein